MGVIRKIRTFATLTSSRRRLALATIALMGAVRLAIWVLPFRVVKRIAEAPASARLLRCSLSPEEVAWAVRLASRHIPVGNCLPQALTAQMLLTWSAIESRLHIGVAKETGFMAHAWIECNGIVLVGGRDESERYVPILTLQGLQPVRNTQN